MGKKTDATADKYVKKSRARDPSYRRIYGNYPAQKYKKGTPAVTRLSFEMTGNATQYIDLALALSILNRKAYRQGCYYYINSVEVYNNNDFIVDFHTLPDTWMTRAAYRRGLGIWNEQNARAMDTVGNIAGKWHDFKVYMSDRHRTTGSELPNTYDINSATANQEADDWDYSLFVSADDDGDANQNADDMAIHVLGPHVGSPTNWTSVGLIQSYEDTRGRISPEPVVDTADLLADPLANLFDYSSEEQLNEVFENLLDHGNDQPPYKNDIMNGKQDDHHQHVGRAVTTATLGRVTKIDGFCAPLGLIMVDPQGTSPDDNFRVVVNLAVGTYHGVYAEKV